MGKAGSKEKPQKEKPDLESKEKPEKPDKETCSGTNDSETSSRRLLHRSLATTEKTFFTMDASGMSQADYEANFVAKGADGSYQKWPLLQFPSMTRAEIDATFEMYTIVIKPFTTRRRLSSELTACYTAGVDYTVVDDKDNSKDTATQIYATSAPLTGTAKTACDGKQAIVEEEAQAAKAAGLTTSPAGYLSTLTSFFAVVT